MFSFHVGHWNCSSGFRKLVLTLTCACRSFPGAAQSCLAPCRVCLKKHMCFPGELKLVSKSFLRLQQKKSTCTNELPKDVTPCVQQPLKSWDATQTDRVPPVKIPLPSISNADADSARENARPLSQPSRHPTKPAHARKPETGTKSKTTNDKISKLSSIVCSLLLGSQKKKFVIHHADLEIT